jgi:AbrB family looped-hinge helix DNA binding protein
VPQSRLSSKGRLVIPKEVRDFLRVTAGDRIDFVVRDDGQVLIRPAVTELADLRGLLARRDERGLTVDEMNEAIREGASRQ